MQAETGRKAAHTRDTHVHACVPPVHMDRAGSHPSDDFASLMSYVLGNMEITFTSGADGKVLMMRQFVKSMDPGTKQTLI